MTCLFKSNISQSSYTYILEIDILKTKNELTAYALAEGTRYEAVVVFNDLSGYTKMTEEDEDKALTLASLFHKEGKKVAKAEKGRVVETIGEQTLKNVPEPVPCFKIA